MRQVFFLARANGKNWQIQKLKEPRKLEATIKLFVTFIFNAVIKLNFITT